MARVPREASSDAAVKAVATKTRESSEAMPTSVALPKLMVFSTSALVIFSLALTVFAGPLFELAFESANELMERTPYIEAVYPDGVPTEGTE